MLAEIDVRAPHHLPTHRGVGKSNDVSTANAKRSRPAIEVGSSEELLERLHRGDCELFYELAQPFLNNVYRFICSMLHDRPSADDVF